MGMLEVFFPGLAEIADEKLPVWPESSAPWSILSYDESGLLAQMGDLLSEEGSVFIHPTATIGDFVEIEGLATLVLEQKLGTLHTLGKEPGFVLVH